MKCPWCNGTGELKIKGRGCLNCKGEKEGNDGFRKFQYLDKVKGWSSKSSKK